jgi:hypothetical protein
VGPARRVVLTIPALAVPAVSAAGCAGSSKPGGLTRAQVDADAQARARVAASETELIARYDAALALPEVSGNPALAARLSGVRAEHAGHLAAVRTPGAASGPSPSPPSAGPSSRTNPSPGPSQSPPSPGATTTSSAPPADAKTAVAGLVTAEHAAASRLTADVLAMDGPMAQLLASISASESGHAALLLGATS